MKLLQMAKSDWKKMTKKEPHFGLLCTKLELDKEVKWFEENLTEQLNCHAKVTKVISFSKR